MSYHIVNIDAPRCSLSCRKGLLTCQAGKGETAIPLDEVAAVIITSSSAVIHSQFLLRAAQEGIGLVLCDQFKTARLVLPAHRCADTELARAQVGMPVEIRTRLWWKTVDAKVNNQLALARHLAPGHPSLVALERQARSRHPYRESSAARLFWGLFSDTIGHGAGATRGRRLDRLNPLLNYGYAVLLSTVLQNCFAVGFDPTAGIHHAVRKQATPLGYDLLEPFRPCVDFRVAQWVKGHPVPEQWEVDKAFRRWVSGFLLAEADYQGAVHKVRGCIEQAVRSFRSAVIAREPDAYQPWTHRASTWAD
jgi:CRISPR-associated endonuclease Cas1 subtype II